MSAFTGMNIEAVRSLGVNLGQKADEINSTMTSLQSQLQAVEWNGPDADQFRNAWDGDLKAKLQVVIDQLRDAGEKAKRNAQEQQDASAAGGN